MTKKKKKVYTFFNLPDDLSVSYVMRTFHYAIRLCPFFQYGKLYDGLHILQEITIFRAYVNMARCGSDSFTTTILCRR